MSLQKIVVTVEAREGEFEDREAEMFVCENCGSKRFMIFQIVGQTHFHLQCDDCETSYCPDGHCIL